MNANNQLKKLYKHTNTGFLAWFRFDPNEYSSNWTEIPIMYEDQLPKDITEELYDWWYKNSIINDGVRMGLKL